MTELYDDLSEEQQKILDDGALLIIKIKRDARSKLAALDDKFLSDDGGFGSACKKCECTDFLGDEDDIRCKKIGCGHFPRDHVFT